jgi:hypothetical protein
MMSPISLPDQTFEGGVLPVNADRIERRLAEVWSLATHSGDQGQDLVKVCLANIVVVCDGLTRPEAEILALAIAREYPSRVILTVVDEEIKSYYAFVRTSCVKDPASGAIRCWEIIELVSEQARVTSIVGALRSLLVDSVPVVTVDFRPFQSTPALDSMLAELSDLVLVDAGIVPARASVRQLLPLRWFHTLPIRLLIGDFFGMMTAQTNPSKFTVYSQPNRDTYYDLLAGWLVTRLEGRNIAVSVSDEPSDEQTILSIEFGHDLDRAVLRIAETPEKLEWKLHYRNQCVTRSAADWPLASYIVGTLQDSSEQKEFEAVTATIARMRHHS